MELPLKGSLNVRRWALMDAVGHLRFGTMEGDAFAPSALRLAEGHGDLDWVSMPVAGRMPPSGRQLVLGHGPGKGLPWEVSVEESETSARLSWEPPVEGESFWKRSRLMEVPRLARAGTNELMGDLPSRFDLRLELPETPHARMTLGMGSDRVHISIPGGMVVINGNTNRVPQIGVLRRWVVHKSPGRLEVVGGGGRFRACVSPNAPEVGGPLVLERPGGWWSRLPYLVLHELRDVAP